MRTKQLGIQACSYSVSDALYFISLFLTQNAMNIFTKEKNGGIPHYCHLLLSFILVLSDTDTYNFKVNNLNMNTFYHGWSKGPTFDRHQGPGRLVSFPGTVPTRNVSPAQASRLSGPPHLKGSRDFQKHCMDKTRVLPNPLDSVK